MGSPLLRSDPFAVRGRAKPTPLLTVGGREELEPNRLSELIQSCILAGGDDYELCFTAPLAYRTEIENISATLALPLTRIGKITEGNKCTVRKADGSIMQIKEPGYDHFA